eukprot:Lithocolla_globosa_v1_NODE_227_length_5021_cov_32.669553.p4 type:complete len:101 gc:universal NODE_227_length_5021_cov_32.669553:449-147(-)
MLVGAFCKLGFGQRQNNTYKIFQLKDLGGFWTMGCGKQFTVNFQKSHEHAGNSQNVLDRNINVLDEGVPAPRQVCLVQNYATAIANCRCSQRVDLMTPKK